MNGTGSGSDCATAAAKHRGWNLADDFDPGDLGGSSGKTTEFDPAAAWAFAAGTASGTASGSTASTATQNQKPFIFWTFFFLLTNIRILKTKSLTV
jgi:hypothetical protein